jgi:hypothetical protein
MKATTIIDEVLDAIDHAEPSPLSRRILNAFPARVLLREGGWCFPKGKLQERAGMSNVLVYAATRAAVDRFDTAPTTMWGFMGQSGHAVTTTHRPDLDLL